MTSATHMLLSSALTFGVPLALALRELLAVYRPSAGGGDEPPPEPRLPRPPAPLPACLLPPPTVRERPPIRVLEDA